jgi:pectate lyase
MYIKKILFKGAFILLVLCVASACESGNKKASSDSTNISSIKEVIAFPEAEGAGKYTKGGRGGDVYCVTNLNDSGEGSLRDAIKTISGPRTVVFDVAGTIRLKSNLEIRNISNLTIAGQTAPGKGITIADYAVKIHDSKDVIVRYLRVRLGDENKPPGSGLDCIEINYNENIILDHLSLSWGIDGNGDFRGLKNATLQWIIFSEALHNSIHEDGPHGMCTSFREPKGPSTIHHNIYASSRSRHPTINGGPDVTEFCNNVNYNWSGPNNIDGEQINVMANYYKAGPSIREGILPIQFKSEKGIPPSKGYLAGNYFEGLPQKYNEDNYTAMDYGAAFGPDSKYQSTTREAFEANKAFDAGIYKLTKLESAKEAYESCLMFCGCSVQRDLVDERLINTITNNTGKVIDSQSEVGGWDFYEITLRPGNFDTDKDGMPDAWEIQYGFDPADPEDRKGDHDADGYTNLEEYLNSLVLTSDGKNI